MLSYIKNQLQHVAKLILLFKRKKRNLPPPCLTEAEQELKMILKFLWGRYEERCGWKEYAEGNDIDENDEESYNAYVDYFFSGYLDNYCVYGGIYWAYRSYKLPFIELGWRDKYTEIAWSSEEGREARQKMFPDRVFGFTKRGSFWYLEGSYEKMFNVSRESLVPFMFFKRGH